MRYLRDGGAIDEDGIEDDGEGEDLEGGETANVGEGYERGVDDEDAVNEQESYEE